MMKPKFAVLSIALISGCAQMEPQPSPPTPECYTPPKVASDFDRLLAFAAKTAELTPAARAEQCKALVKQNKDAPNLTNRLQLLVGRVLSETCGDITKILDDIGSLPPAALPDEAMKQFVATQTATLKQLQGYSKKLGNLERKQRTVHPAEAKEKSDVGTPKTDETRLLREKLEAIRSMEKQLDESGGDAK